MSRYIDAEPLEHRSPKLRALILEQPTVDVVEVVRCKDCKYWNDWKVHTYCGRFDEYDFMPSDGYCSYGERKDD